MSIDVPPPVTIGPGTHRFFDDLITALAAQASLTAGYLTHAGHSGYRFLDDWPMRLVCLTRRDGNSILEIELKPASILTPLTKFAWPTSLDLKFEVVTNVGTSASTASSTATITSPLGGMQRIYATIIEHAFIAYFERHRNEINNARSRAGGGLTALAFANALRNSFAHGGVIHFEKGKAGLIVSWAGLSYSDQDNGRQVMYNDMSQGDVILLMLEMDRLF
jgi:hypothetical protein